MKKNELRYQGYETSILGKINDKLTKKQKIVEFLGISLTLATMPLIYKFAMAVGFNYIEIIILTSFTMVGGLSITGLLKKQFEGNYKENEELINKFNIEIEMRKLETEEKNIVKTLSKDKELLEAINYISDLEFDEDRIELLKNTVLNKSIVNTIQVLDNKDCIDALASYDFDKENLIKAYHKTIETGTKPKSLVKAINEISK